MKKYIKHIIFSIVAFTVFSCADNKVSEYKEVEATLSVRLNEFKGELANPLVMKITNHTGFGNTESFIQEINKIGENIHLSDLTPGVYTFNISGKLTAEESLSIFGVNSEMMIKANKASVRVFDYEVLPIEISLEASTTSALIFKEIYYSGCRYLNPATNKEANYFYEQFYEIYNNSDEIIYLDSLCISDVYPVSGIPLDFGEENKDYLFGLSVWMIDGKGKDVPLNPGESIVIAQSGRNHKEVSESLLDLSTADYETYVEKLDGSAPLDYPVPNMIRAYWTQPATVKQWLVSPPNGAGMVIYKLPYPFDPTDTAKPQKATKETEYVRIPKSSILDAVETLKDDTKFKEKRLPAYMDAGYATTMTSYNKKSIARKILQTTEDGRIIFQDTNNSSEDFEVMDDPQTKRYLNQ